MKFLILAAGLSAALGFTYSAFRAGPYIPVDPSCKKHCALDPRQAGALEVVTPAFCVQRYNLFNCQGYSYLRLSRPS